MLEFGLLWFIKGDLKRVSVGDEWLEDEFMGVRLLIFDFGHEALS